MNPQILQKDTIDIYKFIFDEIDELIAILNPKKDYIFEFINERAYKEYLNYHENDLLGKSFLKIIDHKNVQKIISFLKQIKFKKSKIAEIKIRDNSNNFHWFEMKAKCFYNKKHQNKILIILDSISKQKELETTVENNKKIVKRISKNFPEIHFWKLITPEAVEDQLFSSYEFLQTIVNNIPQYIFWKDKDLIYLGCNNKYANLIGCDSPETAIGKKDEDIFQNQDLLKKTKRNEKKVIKYGYPQNEKVIKWTQGHKTFLFDVNRIPLYDSNEKVVGILVTYNDLTELKESEQKFREITEQSIMGIAIIQEGRIKYINKELADIFGYKPEELKKYPADKYFTLIHPDDREHVKWQSKKTQRGDHNTIHHYQFKGIKKDNQVIWLDLYSKTIRYHGELAELIMIIDITEKKRYQKLIMELNVNFLNFTTDIQTNIQTLLNSCVKLLDGKLAIYIHKDEKEKILKIISNKEKIYSAIDLERFKDTIFASEFYQETHDFPQTFLDIKRLKYTKKDPFINKYDINAAYGKLIKSQDKYNDCICVFFNKLPVITHDHQLVLFIISAAIEIEQKRWQVNQHLKEQNKVLEEMSQFKSDLLTRTSHELKTPLISIKGFTNLLLEVYKDKMDSKMISIVNEIMDGSLRLENIIKNLIESSKLDQNLIKLDKQLDNLTPLIKNCIEDFKNIANIKEHSIAINLHNSLITRFDKEKIQDVLSNILLNAIKYTSSGGNIKIFSQKTKDEYIISVKDSGIGITSAEKDRIFKKFGKIERYGEGLDLDIEGSGLGLYISKKIIHLHDGRIWVKSKGRGKGSIFSFSLPIVN
jgi:PAS domain S-box-containing protein